MKGIPLCLCLLFCYISGFSQSVSTNASTYNDGDKVIMTASGETNERYFQSFMLSGLPISTAPGEYYGVYITTRYVSDKMYQPGQSHKSEYHFTVHNSYSQPITVNLTFSCPTLSIPTPQTRTVSITVNPKPVVVEFGNDAKSQVFYRNNCPSGSGSDPYTYSVPAGKYKAGTKQDANNLAQNEINANGQNTANANTQCYQLYYNKEVSGSFLRNNCTTGAPDPIMAVPYTIAANAYSAKSQSEADALALANLNAKGQANANAVGACGAGLLGPRMVKKNNSYNFMVRGGYEGSTYSWSTYGATINGSRNTSEVEVQFNMSGSARLSVTVTAPNGYTQTLQSNFTVAECTNCPLE